jgi:anaerobic ribonucleoside-triphosphate reductase activating protein
MTIRVSRVHFPVTVLGPGRRMGIWLQGCGVGCAGCVSRDTWARDGGQAITVAALLAWCGEQLERGADGVTISGGEPFEQPAPLLALLEGLAALRAARGATFDVLCYSGLPMGRLRREHAAILVLLDALIPEPFVHTRPLGTAWQGSDNQPLLVLSPRGAARFGGFIDGSRTAEPEFQLSVDGPQIWLIGIPRRGDMQRLERLAQAGGLGLGETSWR